MSGQELKKQKAVLISIQPWWCVRIARGEKTVEVRKTAPKLKTPFKCYIYCTNKRPFLAWGDVFRGNWETEFTDISGYSRERAEKIWDLFNGKVMGEFICDRIDPADVDHIKDIAKAACLSLPEMWEYGRKSSAFDLFGWHISNLVIYDDPKPLSEFYKCGAVPMDDLDEELCCHCAETDYGEKKECHTPSGVWMCEGRWCAEAYQAYLDEEFALTRPPQSWCYVEEV